MSERARCIQSLLEIDPDQLSDEELLNYVYAMRSALAWTQHDPVRTTPDVVIEQDGKHAPAELFRRCAAVEKHNWRAEPAADELGISRPALTMYLNEHAPAEWLERWKKSARSNQRLGARVPHDVMQESLRSVEQCGWNVEAAAHELGITPCGLYARIRRYAPEDWRDQLRQNAGKRRMGRGKRDRELEQAHELMEAQN